MEVQFNINEAYRQAFGINMPIFVASTKEENSTDLQFDQAQKLKIDASDVQSSIGSLVLSQVTFLGGNYQVRNSDGTIKNIAYDNFILPPTTTLQPSRMKEIVYGQRRGASGKFKEYITLADYDITIRGILLGEDLKRPEQAIKQLHQLNNVPTHIGVVCDYLGWLDIQYLVIKKLTFPDLKGQPSMQPFQLDCVADEPVNLILNG